MITTSVRFSTYGLDARRAVTELDEQAVATDPFLARQLITYLGNKRKLLPFINETIKDVKKLLGAEGPVMADFFSGSGCVARLMKYYASKLYANDLESYARTTNTCYLSNVSEVDIPLLQEWITQLNAAKPDATREPGFIQKHYAPVDDANIRPGERAFYTSRNARMIDEVRMRVEEAPPSIRPHLIASLLVEASIHTNTSGTFRGFHKRNGIGHFGGSRGDDLVRIAADIRLEMPVFCERECEVEVLQMDAAEAARTIGPVDIAYLDSPYNEHPYGSNYFMLNVVNDYDNPPLQQGVVGITEDWNRSPYNMIRHARKAVADMLDVLKQNGTKVVLLSYSNEGIIPEAELRAILENYGQVEPRHAVYHTYPGGKNIRARSPVVSEHLWIVKLCRV